MITAILISLVVGFITGGYIMHLRCVRLQANLMRNAEELLRSVARGDTRIVL